MRMIFILTMCSVAQACQPVDAPNILGKDLAAANPIFATVDPASIIAAAPLPGVRRVFHPEELTRIARVYAIAPEALSELCFERATTPLTADELLPILQNALGPDQTAGTEPRATATGFSGSIPPPAILQIPLEIQILDFTHSPIPRGTLEFTRAGLDATGMWRGRIKYDENRSAPIWVKVRVTTEQTWIEAAVPLAPGKPIEAAQLTSRTGPRFPFGPTPVSKIDDALSRTPIRSIRPGEPIFPSMLTTPHEVERGDKVIVEVSSGDARLSFDAVADSSARIGENVLIKNPENGRRFQARVEAKGKVTVKK